MTRLLLLPLSLLLLGICSNSFAQQSIDCKGPADICQFFNHFVTVFNDRDWNQFNECLAEDVTGLFDASFSPDRKNGRAAVAAMFRPMFPETGAAPKDRFLIKPEDLLVQDLGDAAIITFHMRQPGQFSRRCFVLRKRNNKWEIVHINGSSFASNTK